MLKTKKVLFEVGQLLATPGALSLMREYKIDAMRLPSRQAGKQRRPTRRRTTLLGLRDGEKEALGDKRGR